MIKGFKNMKMATIITLSVAVISLLCLSCLYLVMTSSVTQTSKQSSIDNMYTALDGQANMIELFVQESERSLRQYATADELKELLLAPDNAAKQQAAQAYTERFFAQLESWEGVYLSKWDTTVLAHSSPSAVGMVTRKGDALAPYQATMTSAPNGFYNGGAFVSPASGQLIFNLRMSITDDAGKPIGLVGGGPFLAGLNDLSSVHLGKLQLQVGSTVAVFLGHLFLRVEALALLHVFPKRLLLEQPQLCDECCAEVKETGFEDAVLAQLFDRLCELGTAYTTDKLNNVLDDAAQTALARILAHQLPEGDMDKLMQDCLRQMRRLRLEKEYEKHRLLADEYERSADERILSELMESQRIKNEIKKLYGNQNK